MKKWIIGSFCVLAAMVLFIELFIPSTLVVSSVEMTRCKAAAAFPFLSDEGQWKRWWPDSSQRAGFHIQRLSYQAVDIGIRNGGQTLDSKMNLLPAGSPDSSYLHWETQIHCGWSPADRVSNYFRARGLKREMDGILGQAGLFLDKSENVYGIRIWEGSTRDTLLIGIRAVQVGIPTDQDIYAKVTRLKQYVAEMHSRQTGDPMVNVLPMEDRRGTYRLMVALPVGNRIEGKADVEFMRLIPGKYLITEVRGGPGTVDKALSALKDYIRDYQRTVMAIPFQVMVTDRMQVADSAQWVTRIYYPVM